MKPILVLTLLLCACTDRALDAEGGGVLGPGVDLAGLDLAGRDLSTTKPVDLAIPKDPIDLASPTPQVGVPCGSELCTQDQVCCPLSGVASSKCFPVGMGMGMNACPMGQGYRCDGPEDCTGNRVCVGGQGFGMGPPQSSRCRMNAGPDATIICHDDGDCPMSDPTCTPVMTPPNGTPPLSICK